MANIGKGEERSVGDRHHLQCEDPAVEEKKIAEAAEKYKPISAAGGLEVPFLLCT